ncbi:phosphoglycerate mutase [Bacillus sp. FJAT-18017]|uniref:histidine phosphatase family protein n=1 Tax=Bacillus sp. FJAT-18017 TaxID=1705566 RepID=UPI0006B01674|nr:histidine phosphatase family protein [Bacillus sp. FJAT-18017]ALC90743.1 phosphoglycerate mutase [Bacillus sp. FJAT-18017]
MLTNLFFVRHAHSDYTPDELGRPLSQQGQADAHKITKYLEKEAIDFIVSSPYERAIQTVKGVADCIGKEIILEDDFKERNLAAGPVNDFQYAIKKVWEDPSFSWEGGESNIIAQKRGITATLRVLERFQGHNIVIGTHGNIMVLIMNYLDNKYVFEFWENLDMPDIYKLTFNKTELIEVRKIWEKVDSKETEH